jgi:hypothetical protein
MPQALHDVCRQSALSTRFVGEQLTQQKKENSGPIEPITLTTQPQTYTYEEISKVGRGQFLQLLVEKAVEGVNDGNGGATYS